MTSFERHLEQLMRERLADYRREADRAHLARRRPHVAQWTGLRTRLAAWLAQLAVRLEPVHRGPSLQEYLRAQRIGMALRPDPAILMAGVQERKRRTQSRMSVERILAHRDADRR